MDNSTQNKLALSVREHLLCAFLLATIALATVFFFLGDSFGAPANTASRGSRSSTTVIVTNGNSSVTTYSSSVRPVVPNITFTSTSAPTTAALVPPTTVTATSASAPTTMTPPTTTAPTTTDSASSAS